MSTIASPSGETVFTYNAPWLIYALNWSNRSPFRLAIGSFVEEYSNTIEIIQLNENKSGLKKVTQFKHPYPPTKIMWAPDTSNITSDLIATTGDFLRIWDVSTDTIKEKHILTTSVRKKIIPKMHKTKIIILISC